MPELMKKPHIEHISIIISGPQKNLGDVIESLRKHRFNLVSVEKEEGIPWREVAKDEIKKYSEPGLVLRGARLKEGFSQVALCKKLKITQSNLSKMEHGKRPIGKKMAKRLSKILKVGYRIFL